MGETTSGADDKGGSTNKGDSGPSYGASDYGTPYGGSAPAYYDPAPVADYSYTSPVADYSYQSPVADYSAPAADYSYQSPVSGLDLGYLGGPAGWDASSGGVAPDYSGGAAAPDYYLPPGAAPASGPDPWAAPVAPPAPAPMVGHTGYGVQEFFANNAPAADTPAGASGGADLATLARVNSDPTTSIDTPGGVLGGAVPAGPSAAGGLPGVGGGGGGDLTQGGRDIGGARDREDGWKNTFGIKDPVGTALAAGALGANMWQGRQQQNQAGQPVADLRNLAAQNTQMAKDLQAEGKPIIQEGLNTTQQGVDLLQQGNADLRARAVATDPNARTLIDRGTGLTGYVGTGTLPPEMQAQIDQSKADARTGIISRYASRGMPTDPAKNSSLRAELLDLDRRSTVMASQMAENLAKTGLAVVEGGAGLNRTSGTMEQAAGGFGTNVAGAGNSVAQTGASLVDSGMRAANISNQAYDSLIRADQAQADRTQKAIAAMAAALSGRTASPTVQIGGTRP